MSLSMTIVTVPYLAIQPEMAVDYDERTSLNTYRTIGSLVGTLGAISVRIVADAFGGGAAGFAWAGAVYGLLITLPWLMVYRATFERPQFQNQPRQHLGFRNGVRQVFENQIFLRLTAIYLMGRIAMDLAGALIILYATYWLGRSSDFEIVMSLFLGSTILALPVWLKISHGREKSQVFIFGAVWWMVSSGCLALVQPDWPRWILFVFVPLVGVGYAVVDLMPWSMLGEVIDEDALRSGDRREGIYNGVLTFVRKLGGALGVFIVMSLLDLAGFRSGEEQTETARQAIRLLTAFGPAFFLAAAVWLSRGYPLTREAHRRILAEIEARDAADPKGVG
jgi:oligogalacturonide transporter